MNDLLRRIDELLPCPFCGGEARARAIDDDGNGYAASCDTVGCACNSIAHSEAQAIERWNRRTALADKDAQRANARPRQPAKWLAVPCPSCEQPAGVYCTTREGWGTAPHRPRLAAARAIEQGEPT